MKLYSVYDVVRADFAPPFIAKNDGEACRMFLQGARKISTVRDLRLFRICEWCPDDFNDPIPLLTKPEEIPVQIGEVDEE